MQLWYQNGHSCKVRRLTITTQESGARLREPGKTLPRIPQITPKLQRLSLSGKRMRSLKISWKCRCEIRKSIRLHKEFDSIVHWFGKHVGLAQSLTFVSDGHVRWILFFCSIAGKQIVSIVMYTHLQLSSKLNKSSVRRPERRCESRIKLIFVAR